MENASKHKEKSFVQTMKQFMGGLATRKVIHLAIALLITIGIAYAADPGHSATVIGPGTFETGDYTFPGNVYTVSNIWANGTINSSINILVNSTSVCLSNGVNCPAGSVDQNLFATFTGNKGSTTADSTTDTLNIVGGLAINTTVSADTLTISFNATNLTDDSIAEEKIDFNTNCLTGNHLFITGNNLDCEADDDTPDSDAEVPNIITVQGGTFGNNTVIDNSKWTLNGNLSIAPLYINSSTQRVGVGTDSPIETLEISNGTQSVTVDANAATPTINTTGSTDLKITSATGNVIITLG